MAITGNASYIATMDTFISHWRSANEAFAPEVLLVRRPDNTACSEADFSTLRSTVQSLQNAVQAGLIRQAIVRGAIHLKKVSLIAQLGFFNRLLLGYYQGTDFNAARPYAPSLSDGQEVFTRPLGDMLYLWDKINEGPAPAGVTLPLKLGDGTTHEAFTLAVDALQSAYAAERRAGVDLTLARAKRNRFQDQAYEIMKAYREVVPALLPAHPVIIETLPRLTPLPGHTPEPVAATAFFEAPNTVRVVYEASTEAMLYKYELRGCSGDSYNEEDAVVIATHRPQDAREFVTTFGLNQPGAQVALKVFVILTTDNECGSSALVVERPAQVELLVA